MDKNLYKIMQEILEEKKTGFTKDIEFLGSITSEENTSTGKVGVTRDIFMLIDEMPDGTIVKKFYDNDKNFIAGCDKEGKIYPSAEFASSDLSFLGQLENLTQVQGISLNEMDEHLERIAKTIGVSKKDVLSMSEIDLEQKVKEKETPQLSLSKDDEEKGMEEQDKSNKDALDNIASKQEVKLDNKIDDRHTLGDVLGVPAGSKLIAVYSNSIADNKNTTKFSFIIQNADGSLEPADMLEQVGGKESDKSVYETNRDGSEVEKQSVKSSYAINSPIVKNGILTARIGSMGYIELGYGQIDRTSNKDAFTQKLETEHTRYTTYEVREEFSSKNGIDNIPENMDEIRTHEEAGCKNLTLDEADGNRRTGHVHGEHENSTPVSVNEMLSPDMVQQNVQEIIYEFPSNDYVRNNALQTYLSVVREHGESTNVCIKEDIKDEVISRLQEEMGNQEISDRPQGNEHEDDYIPMHRH